MIYLIDDKKSRQNSYGWSDERFENIKCLIIRIVGEEDLNKHIDQIIAPGNIILIHDSFLDGNSNVFNEFKLAIENMPEIQVCHFSGSYCGRCVEGRVAYLSPYLVYTNLETFINKHNNNNTNFQYLAFGDNLEKEKALKDNYEKFVTDPINLVHIESTEPQKKIAYFETTGDLSILSPFKIPSIKNWDYPSHGISFQDIDFDSIIKDFLNEKFDIIYLPLCFGDIFSDYLGLRFTMYIRFSQGCNQNTPIVLYGGISRFSEIIKDECFDALKLPNIKLIGLNYRQIISTEKEEYSEIEMSESYLKRISIQLPQKYNDNHDVSNIWCLQRWHSMFDWGTNIPKITDSDLTKSLYFRYLEMRYGVHDKFKNRKKREPKIPFFDQNKRIVYIDDDHNKGWGAIFNTIFKNSHVEFDIFDKFDKKISKNELRELLVNFVKNSDADCYILGIKLHSDDFLDNTTKPLGLEIAKEIKKLNRGNQIIFFTASKNIEDHKKALNEINAAGYILKEAPVDNLSTMETERSFIDFSNIVRDVCNKRSFLRTFYSKQKDLINKTASNELDSIGNLLTLYSEVSNESAQANRTKQELLGAILLFE